MSNYHIKHLEEYYQVYRKSVRAPEQFWEEIAEEHFLWHKKWDKSTKNLSKLGLFSVEKREDGLFAKKVNFEKLPVSDSQVYERTVKVVSNIFFQIKI